MGKTPEEKAAKAARKAQRKAEEVEEIPQPRKSPRLAAAAAVAKRPPALDLAEEPPAKKQKGKKDKSEKPAKDKKVKTLEAVAEPKSKKQKKVADCAAADPKAVTSPPDGSSSSLSGAEYDKQMQISYKSVGNVGPAPAPVQQFDQAPWNAASLKLMKNSGFMAPSPIQAACWPACRKGVDVIAIAKTGSGKTLAFLMPLFDGISSLPKTKRGMGPYAVVMAPTRELASQISQQADKFGDAYEVHSVCIYGGSPKGPQIGCVMRGARTGPKYTNDPPSILIATPGRLNDFLKLDNPKVLDLNLCKWVILDEADRMLDMGFEPQIRTIIEQVPDPHQTLFFTATRPKDVKQMAAQYISPNHFHITVGSSEITANKQIEQQFIMCNDHGKMTKILEILKELPKTSKVLMFANTKASCESFASELSLEGLPAVAIHGDKEQWQRERALWNFTSGRRPFMVATDVAARGLDIDNVTHVVNIDFPIMDPVESYVHRIGRTARGGKSGKAISLMTDEALKSGKDMKHLIRLIKEAGQEVPAFIEEAAAKAQKMEEMKRARYGTKRSTGAWGSYGDRNWNGKGKGKGKGGKGQGWKGQGKGQRNWQ
eukprot:TRINITY_DN9203_c0_g1_i5.p1 TRINITY_DN9203_c0_g1~~TRINITY_DN9203_c0_g1_i5.p1  ORF type:complete len:599 (-),score=104.82 TRINITY_DN9203_c0_g1_i5:94-1890(-)